MERIELSVKIKPGTILGKDIDPKSQQIMISDQGDVLKTNNGYSHPYALLTRDKKEVYKIPEKGTKMKILSMDLVNFVEIKEEVIVI